MKAIVYEEYGTTEKFQMQELAIPQPKDDEVLIKVRAVSINDFDFGLLTGRPFVNRMINGFRRPKIQILGSDIAGVVESVGKKVTRFGVGDAVYGDQSGRWGGFAEYICAPETALALKPESMSFEEAAAIPQAAMLAVQGLIDAGKIRKGQKILINGAGGGVGAFGLQIAKLYDAEVTGVDRASKLAMMKEQGFDHVIDYEADDFTGLPEKYDIILDAKTTRSPFSFLRVLKKGGTYATVGGDLHRLLQIALCGFWLGLFTGKHLKAVGLKMNKDLVYMNRMYEEGKVVPLIDGPFAFDNYMAALQLYERAEHKGKVVITVS